MLVITIASTYTFKPFFLRSLIIIIMHMDEVPNNAKITADKTGSTTFITSVSSVGVARQ